MVGRLLPTAMCVRGFDDLCVLQFTLVNAAGCALHRRTSRVIHRIELYFGKVSRGGEATISPRSRADPSQLRLHGEIRKLRASKQRGTQTGLHVAV